MAKKKSSRFIIPASYFISTIVEEKIDVPNQKIKDTVTPQSKTGVVQEERGDYSKRLIKTSDQVKNIILSDIEIVKPDTNNLINTSRKKSALSISSIKRNKIEKEKLKSKQKVKVNLDNLPKDPFTEEIFLSIWYSYINELHNKGEKIFASVLKADTPKIKNNFICMTYPNEMMKAELIRVKPKTLKYLRTKLNNYSIDFKITINEENTKKFAYTPQEKYDLLKEKNDAIIKLRKTFNLDL